MSKGLEQCLGDSEEKVLLVSWRILPALSLCSSLLKSKDLPPFFR